MTEITAPKSPVTAEQFADEIREQLKYTQNVTAEQATAADVYVAVSKAVRRAVRDLPTVDIPVQPDMDVN